MNDKIREHVKQYNISKGYGIDDESIIETIRESDSVWSGDEDEQRWWVTYFTVIQVNGMFIGFENAKTTGDDSPYDKGWEFDAKSICEVVAEQITTTIYKRVNQ